MAKTLSCRDAGVDCDYVARGETEEKRVRTSAPSWIVPDSFPNIPPGFTATRFSVIGRRTEFWRVDMNYSAASAVSQRDAIRRLV
jgi:hypothetical protein